MKTYTPLAWALLSLNLTLLHGAEIRTIDDLHDSLEEKYPDQVVVKPGVSITKVTHLSNDILTDRDAKPIENCRKLIENLPPVPQALPQDCDITDNNGRKLSGTILDKDDTTIKFRRTSDQKEFDIPIDTLSAADRKFIRECQDAIPRSE